MDAGGRTMQGCNDCSLDYSGNLWVTAPAGNIAPDPYLRSFEVKNFLSNKKLEFYDYQLAIINFFFSLTVLLLLNYKLEF